MWVQTAGIAGAVSDIDLEEYRNARPQRVAFEIAALLVKRFYTAHDAAERPWLFPRLSELARRWLDECVTYGKDAFVGLLLPAQHLHAATEKLFGVLLNQEGNRSEVLVPMFRRFDPEGSTADVDFLSRKPVIEASKSQVSHVVLDGIKGNTWEEGVAAILEKHSDVNSFVKNDHLGFTIPYVHEGRSHQYWPDFLVRLNPTADGTARTLIIEVSGGQKVPRPHAGEGRHRPRPVVRRREQPRRMGPLGLPRNQQHGPGRPSDQRRHQSPVHHDLVHRQRRRRCARLRSPVPPQKKPSGPKPVEATIHPDKRSNIPTADAQDFVAPEVEAPVTVRWKRNHSLDPQLVWKGKDDEAEVLEGDAPPLYIQEKIDPRVLVENLRRTAKAGAVEPELTLFESFDGLPELDALEHYKHDANWSNRMILGDSLNVMASLAEREHLRGKVQMVYLDPPYGIKFGSNWQVSARNRDVTDGKVEDASREVEQIKAFRDTWELGINSYLIVLAGPIACCAGPADGERKLFHANRRRERSPCTYGPR